MKIPLLILFLVCLTNSYSQTSTIKVKKPINTNLENGKKLFRKHCAMCHSEYDYRLTAPPLNGVTKRVTITWFINWVKSSNDLIKSGDPYANAIFKQDGGAQPDFKFLTNQQIKDIFIFVETFGPKPSEKK